MELRVLGPLEMLADDGSRVPDAQPLVRGMICVLALNAGRLLTPDELAELVWPSMPSPGARKTCVYQVRRLLGSRRLVRNNGGYRLVLGAADQLDVAKFHAAAESARRALRLGDQQTAARGFTDALNVWRDTVLRDVPDTVGARAAADKLTGERRRVRDALVAVKFELGHHDDLVSVLEGKTAEEPFNEQGWAELMLALARGGLPVEALHAYERARRTLEIDAGTVPGEELRRLHRQIRDGEATLLVPGPSYLRPSPPHGRSHRLRQLPTDLTDFTGRADQVARLRALFSERGRTPIAVVTGPAGIGKTSLAVRVAHAVGDNYPGGQCIVQMAGSSEAPRDPADMLCEILRAVGIDVALPANLAGLAAMYRSEIAGRRLLVIADDAAGYTQVAPLLPGSPGCGIIITSRVHSTGQVGGSQIQLDGLRDDEALQLLTRIVGTTRVQNEPESAAHLVSQCGGSPLAMRIAGARLATRSSWPLAHMARLLDDPLRRLDHLDMNAGVSVRASIAAGVGMLDERARTALCRLALLGPHDFAAWVVAILLGQSNADDAVEQLVDTSLLDTTGVDATGEARYRLHDLVRAYAAERLLEDKDADVALERLLSAALELVDLADAQLPREPHFPNYTRISQRAIVADTLAERLVSPDPIRWLEAERPNLVALIDIACANGRTRLASGIALRMGAFLHIHGHPGDFESIWQTIMKAAEAGDETQLVEQARYWLATILACDHAEYSRAIPLLDQCVRAFETGHSRRALARALYMRGYCAQTVGRLADAHGDATRAAHLSRQIKDRRTETLALSVLGMVRSQDGRHAEAHKECARAVAIARDLGEDSYHGITLYRLIHVLQTAGEHAESLPLCEEGITLTAQVNHGLGYGYFHLKAGHAKTCLGRHREALSHLQRALEEFQSRGASEVAMARCRRDLAELYQVLGDHAAARPQFEQCAATFRALGLIDEEERAAAAVLAETTRLNGTKPNIARMYDYYLGGKDNYAADREAAERVIAVAPQARALARANRQFLHRAIRFLADEGKIQQFIDVGSGLPTVENTHEVAHREAPGSRVVYVDNDPIVLAHSHALLATNHLTVVIAADMRRPHHIIDHPALQRVIDWSTPVGLLFTSVLQLLTDEEKPHEVVATFRDQMTSGSHVVISHITPQDHIVAAQQGAKVYQQVGATSQVMRSREQILGFFDGFDLIPPGLVPLPDWRPNPSASATDHQERLPVWFLCGIGRKR